MLNFRLLTAAAPDYAMQAIKRFFLSEYSLLYANLAMFSVMLALSLSPYNPAFTAKTTLARLYENRPITVALLILIVLSLIWLHRTTGERKRTASLVVAGVLWGVGIASAFAFDVGVFLGLSFAAGNLYRANARPA
jgi:hypothetical protein